MVAPDRPTGPHHAETAATVRLGPIDATPARLSVLGYACARASGVLTVDIDFAQQTITVVLDPTVAGDWDAAP